MVMLSDILHQLIDSLAANGDKPFLITANDNELFAPLSIGTYEIIDPETGKPEEFYGLEIDLDD